MKPYHAHIVPGLDVLIGDPDILSPEKETKKRANVLYIPEGYIYRAIDFYHEQSSRGDACREIIRHFKTILTAMHENRSSNFCLKNDTVLTFVDATEYRKYLDQDSSKSQAIAVAKYLADYANTYNLSKDDIAIMTGSDQLATLAALNDIDTAIINSEVYTGRRRVQLNFDQENLWHSNYHISAEDWKNNFPSEPPLRLNEFVEFVSESDSVRIDHSFKNIGRFDPDEEALVSLKYTHFDQYELQKIRPRSAGQAMLLEALLLPPDKVPIVVVSGVFGTGKTFLTTAAGYYGVAFADTYERIFICPRDGALGKEIGFVPGDTTEKTLVKARPIADNLREILRLAAPQCKCKNASDPPQQLSARRDCLDKKVEENLAKYFEFEPIINMGGRSLSNSWIFLDEFQDMERYQAKALLSRIGNNSKIIVSGDPTQVTNPHLSYTSNGLSYSASKLAGKPEAIVVTLTEDEIVRSAAAKAIASYF